MIAKTKISYLPLLLAFAACATNRAEEEPLAVAQGQSVPSPHEHTQQSHEHRQTKHEHWHENEQAQRQHQQAPGRQHEHAPHPHERGHEPAQYGGQSHQHSTAASAQSANTVQQIWETDAPLRQGMRHIRAALHTLETSLDDGLSESEVSDFSAQIDNQVAYLIHNCTLQPRADAALHTIIADLIGAVRSLQSGPDQHSALASMHAALLRYARQFNDPEWSSSRPAVSK